MAAFINTNRSDPTSNLRRPERIASDPQSIIEELNRITHAKVLVADDQAVVCTGNWTYNGFVQSHDVAVRTSEITVVHSLKNYVEELFDSSDDFEP